MASEAVRHGSFPEFRSLRMIRIIRPAVLGDMPPGDHHGISLDRLFMYYARMACRASFVLSALHKGLHVLAMAHDEPDIFYRRRQVTNGDFRDAQNMSMACDTHI